MATLLDGTDSSLTALVYKEEWNLESFRVLCKVFKNLMKNNYYQSKGATPSQLLCLLSQWFPVPGP